MTLKFASLSGTILVSSQKRQACRLRSREALDQYVLRGEFLSLSHSVSFFLLRDTLRMASSNVYEISPEAHSATMIPWKKHVVFGFISSNSSGTTWASCPSGLIAWLLAIICGASAVLSRIGGSPCVITLDSIVSFSATIESSAYRKAQPASIAPLNLLPTFRNVCRARQYLDPTRIAIVAPSGSSQAPSNSARSQRPRNTLAHGTVGPDMDSLARKTSRVC